MTVRALWSLHMLVIAIVLKPFPVESQCTTKNCFYGEETDMVKMFLRMLDSMDRQELQMSSMKEELIEMKQTSIAKERPTACISDLGPAAPYCVDLTMGKTSVLPVNTRNVMWTSKPTSNGGRCDLQGVLQITPPEWAKTVSFHMVFQQPSSFSFNIGDSPTNDGWAGDYDSTEYDAEINSHDDNLQVYRSDVGGSGSLVATKSTVKTALLIRLSKNQMYVTNYEGVNYYKEDVGLFAFDTMYMGLNRVVNRIYGPTRRTGRGVCSVCIYFLNDTVKDLHE